MVAPPPKVSLVRLASCINYATKLHCSIVHSGGGEPMQKTRPRRSVLYMPGANDRALEKARSLAADAIILDLEDLVGPEAKVTARKKVTEAVREGGYGRREVVIRPNALETAWGTADLLAAAAAGPDAILLPKVAHPGRHHQRGQDPEIGRRAGEDQALGHDRNADVGSARGRDRGRRRGPGEPARLLRHGHQRSAQGKPGQGAAQQARRRALAGARHRGGARLWPRHHRRRLQRLQGRSRFPRGVRIRPHARHGRQDADPPLADRPLQRDFLSVRGRSRLGQNCHPRLRPDGERQQGRDHRRRQDGRAAASGAGQAHGRHRQLG